MAQLEARILGCGSSGGVPRLSERAGGNWGACNPDNPKNRRTRCALLLTRTNEAGARTRVLIDTTPDFRAQMLAAGVGMLDGVVYTHAHADHVHGLDDLRQVVFNRGARLPVWADEPTRAALLERFGYAFVQPEGSAYPPILDLHPLGQEVRVEGAGGEIVLEPLEVEHGRIRAQGYRIGGLAYLPDVSAIPETLWPRLDGLDTLIVDALRHKPHPTHANLETALEWIARSGARRGVLTNMHLDLDYDAVAAGTPENVTPAHDGMVIVVEP